MARGDKGVATREQLVAATLACIRDAGFAGLSTRVVATRAGVNQALVFYHFETLTGLVVAAYEAAVERAVEHYRDELLPVASLADVLDRAEALIGHEREMGERHGVLMVQLMAQAPHDAALAEVARDALGRWRSLARLVIDEALGASSASAIIDRAAVSDALVTGLLGSVLVSSLDGQSAGGQWAGGVTAGASDAEDRGGKSYAVDSDRDGAEASSVVPGFAALRDAVQMLEAFEALPSAVRSVVTATLKRSRTRDVTQR